MASERGLRLVGALGVLGAAYQAALLDHPLAVLEEMRHGGFRVGDSVVANFKRLLDTRYRRQA